MKNQNDKEQAMRQALEPIANAFRESFISSMILRLHVHIQLARNNGAEPEDMDNVMTNAIESSAAISERFLAELSEARKAAHVLKELRNDK